MPLYPSINILAKDIIGWAQELAAVEEARLTIKSIGRTYYNMAVAEIYNLIGYVDAESLMNENSIDISTPLGKYKNAPIYTVSTEEDFISYDKVVAVEVTNGADTTLVSLQCFPLPIKEFLRHKANTSAGVCAGALHPYEEGVVYTIVGNSLRIIWGTTITIATPLCTVFYTRQPTILTTSNFDTAKMDLPDKYAPLLANRIAAYAEMRQGISDKSMALVQNSYQQILAPLDAAQRSKLIDSFQFTPTFTPNEDKKL